MLLQDYLPILDGLTASVFVVDAERQILLVNSAGRDVFGDGLVGVDFVQVMRNPNCLKAIGKVLGGQKKSEAVVTVQNPVRKTYQVAVTRLGPEQTSGAQNKARAVISLENVSHIYEAEQMRSAFVANVSHELRSPLTSLNGFIETLKGPAKDDAVARERFLSIMESEANRMNRLIDDLLSLSKVEADAHVRPQDTVDLVALIGRVLTVLDPVAKKEGVDVSLDLPVDRIGAVPGDSDQLQQVFVNLVENAIKYGGSGGRVRVVLREIQNAIGISGRAVRVDVTDTGTGIGSEHIPRLTERFYRVDKGRSREKGGTGLGLAIAKHILARHRGRLLIASEAGSGSTFSVVLPR